MFIVLLYIYNKDGNQAFGIVLAKMGNPIQLLHTKFLLRPKKIKNVSFGHAGCPSTTRPCMSLLLPVCHFILFLNFIYRFYYCQ